LIKIARFTSLLTLAVLFFAGMAFAQFSKDPGVRGGAAGAGAAFASVTGNANDNAFFQTATAQFAENQTVTGDNPGLGPRFNSTGCGSCHIQPALGGSGGATNPQFTFTNGAQPRVAPNDATPFFITANGPTREARFPFFFNANGTVNTNNPNGGVEDLFTVSGRADAGNCSLQQPGFNAARAANNIIFRIPTPVFGSGLMNNIEESTLLINRANANNNNLGISGSFNHNGNDGTITRFGWKAQNKSLLLFAGEAYNVEMGITNEIFPQERPLPGEDGNGGSGGQGLPANCINLAGVGYPEDSTHSNGTNASTVASDIQLFNTFMQFLDQPTPSTTTPGGAASIANGRSLFSAIGCANCHTPSLTTLPSNLTAGLGNATANLFSDLAIHHMGPTLADNVSQGAAGGDQFRSAPLWGVGQRIFLLHDGRTTDLVAVIQAHGDSQSEADVVEDNFFLLFPSQQQDILNFLRSL
jgi:CxxC motif-containing protein (DUF1111 family)